MKSFAYRAVHTSGQLHKGVMSAANENALAAFLRGQGLELIEAAHRPDESFQNPLRRLGSPMADEEKIAFYGQMEELLRAGMSLTDALGVLKSSLRDSLLQEPLARIQESLLAGASVADAFACAHTFDPLEVSILRAGEKEGALTGSFGQLKAHGQRRWALGKQVRRAVRYPLFLFCVACGVTLFMMGFVVPQIIVFLESLGTKLPVMTRVLITGARLFTTFAWVIPFIALTVWGGVVFLRRRSESARRACDAWLLKAPIVGGVIRATALARVAASLSLLIRAGVALPTALETAAPLSSNADLEARLERAAFDLATGAPFSKAVASSFPAIIVQRFAVAERCGALASSMDAAAATLEQAQQEKIEAFLGLLEPVLTAFVGGLLAWIVLAVLGPVYGSLGPLAQGI